MKLPARMPASVGYTGPRGGITAMQREALMGLLARYEPLEAHYGDCLGGDLEFFSLARAVGLWTVCHPPLDRRWRAFTHEMADEVRPMKGYLDRAWDIAAESGWLIGTPKEMTEPDDKRGSGTWATIGYARGLSRPVLLVYPDGRIDPGALPSILRGGF